MFQLDAEPWTKLSTLLSRSIEQTTAAGVPQAGVFLDCNKCYERIPLQKFEAFVLERRRHVLIQGAVGQPVTATHGMPLSCGLASCNYNYCYG
eukprot:692076-Amphidinium_carterae.1